MKSTYTVLLSSFFYLSSSTFSAQSGEFCYRNTHLFLTTVENFVKNQQQQEFWHMDTPHLSKWQILSVFLKDVWLWQNLCDHLTSGKQ